MLANFSLKKSLFYYVMSSKIFVCQQDENTNVLVFLLWDVNEKINEINFVSYFSFSKLQTDNRLSENNNKNFVNF